MFNNHVNYRFLPFLSLIYYLQCEKCCIWIAKEKKRKKKEVKKFTPNRKLVWRHANGDVQNDEFYFKW
jgi:hypothetical protein